MNIQEVAHHRNGIAGEGFNVVRFRDGKQNMVGIVFEGEGQVAVFDVALLAEGNIAFGKGNSWRGDRYESDLRKAVTDAGW